MFKGSGLIGALGRADGLSRGFPLESQTMLWLATAFSSRKSLPKSPSVRGSIRVWRTRSGLDASAKLFKLQELHAIIT